MPSSVTLYMFYLIDRYRAFLWYSDRRDDDAAVKRAVEHLKNTKRVMGKLYMGPTGEDEMKFVRNVVLFDA